MVLRLTEEEWRKRLAAAHNGQQARAKRPPDRIPLAGVANGSDRAKPVSILLPWPPTLNHNKQVSPKGVYYLTDEHKAFRREVAGRILEKGLHRLRLSGKLAVTFYASPPDRRRRDLDNIVKPALDALVLAGLLADDF